MGRVLDNTSGINFVSLNQYMLWPVFIIVLQCNEGKQHCFYSCSIYSKNWDSKNNFCKCLEIEQHTVKILNIGTCMSEQTV